MYGFQDGHLLQFCAGIFIRDVIRMLLNASFSQPTGTILRIVNLCTFYARNTGTTKSQTVSTRYLDKMFIVYKSFENVGTVTCKRPFFLCHCSMMCWDERKQIFFPVLIGIAVMFQAALWHQLS
jgi:hypothetical protein